MVVSAVRTNNVCLLLGYPDMCSLLDGWWCGTSIMYYAMKDVKDAGLQQMGYRSLERSWLDEAISKSTGAGIFVAGAKAFKLLS